MRFTVTMVAVAPGAVAKLQLRMIHIGFAADGTAMGVGSLGLCNGCLIGAGIGEGDHFCFLGCGGGGGLTLFKQATGIDPPGQGNHIQHIFAEEQEVIQQSNKGEKTVGEVSRKGQCNDIVEHQQDIQQSEDPCLHRNDEKQQEACVGIHGGVGKKQTHIQMIGGGCSTEEQAEQVHHNDACYIEQIEPESTPDVFDGPSQRVVAQQCDQGKDHISAAVGQRIGDQPPDLTLEDQFPVEGKEIV